MSDFELSDSALITIPEARRYVYRNEDDSSRDGILVDAINDVSESIAEHCEREFLPTTDPDRSGADGVTDGTTSFVAASGVFATTDEGSLINIATKGTYTIVTRTNATTVVLDGSPSAGTALAWDLGEARVFDYDGSGLLDLRPYDLRDLYAITLYTDLEDAQQDALVAADYRLRPAGRARGGTYLALGLPTPNIAQPEYGYGWQVTVRGQWGMAAIPGAVRFACKQWVKNIVENPGQYANYTQNAYSVTPDVSFVGTGAGMPRSVERRLERWKRPDRSPLQVVRFRHPDLDQPAVPYAGLPRAN